MALQPGVTSARAVAKPAPATSLAHASSSGRLVRRRGRGSLVRCRAFVWSKDDLDKLHHLSSRPRHELVPDVVEDHVPRPIHSAATSSENSAATDSDDPHPRNYPPRPVTGAVEQVLAHAVHATSHQHVALHPQQYHNQHPHHRAPSATTITATVTATATATTTTISKPPLQHYHGHHHPHHIEQPCPLHLALNREHPIRSTPQSPHQHNLAAVTHITATLIDLTL